MSARATKNMWVTRCEHIGALVGGVLSKIFGLLGAAWNNLASGGGVFFLAYVGIIFSLVFYIVIKPERYASKEAIRDVLNSNACVSAAVKNKIATSSTALRNSDIARAEDSCERAAKNSKKLAEQQELIK